MTSRLSQMQARFQQKQMQEKEEKLLRLYENQQQRAIERVNRGSAGSNTSVTSVTSITSTQGGKVRQMFDERRQKAGIDRSYPLEPLKTTKTNGYARGNSLDRLKNDKNTSTKTVVKSTVKRSVTHVKNGKPLVNRREVVQSIYNNNGGDESYEEHIYEDDNANGPVMNRTYRQKDLEMMMNDHRINDSLDDEEFPDIDIDEFDEPIVKPKLSNVGGKLPSQNGVVAKKAVEEKVFIKNGTPSPKAPVNGKKETKPSVKKTVVRAAASSPTASPRTSKGLSTVSSASPTRSVSKVPSETMPASTSSKSSQQNPRKPSSDVQRAPSTARPSSKQSGRGPSAVNRDDLAACRYCSRRFAADRLGVHEDICARTAKKKRKAYDATKHRVQGTELEPYTRKGNRTASVKPANHPEAGKPISKQQISKQSKQAPAKKSDWRRKHEEFIGAIRAAKMAQAHVAKGGKLTDLPPPPPSSNPDYVQCPHCGRKFNETAAERHIPKCASYDFNKPKQQARPGAPTSSRNNSKSSTSKGTFR